MKALNLQAIDPRSNRAEFVDDSTTIESRLTQLHDDLNRPLFISAIETGLEGRNSVTNASAPTSAGSQQWLRTVEAIRTILAEKGWKIHNEMNCPFISSPDRRISIVVMTGDPETGKDGDRDPTNQSEKGSVAAGFIDKNHKQLELFNLSSLRAEKDKRRNTQVWVLLYHYDKMQNEVRFELSLPTAFNRNKITAWETRLQLGSVPNNPAVFEIEDQLPNGEFDVLVEPKHGKL